MTAPVNNAICVGTGLTRCGLSWLGGQSNICVVNVMIDINTGKEGNMPTLKQILKSKTIDVNASAAILMAVLGFFGVTPPVAVVTAGFTLLNFGLRFLTKKPLAEK